MRPSIWPNLRRSAVLWMARPVTALALGSAVVVSLAAVCCGVGALATPWFLCELLAVQLAESIGQPVRRGTSWVGAGAVLLGAVLLVSAVAWIGLLGLDVEPSPTGLARPAAWSELWGRAGAFAALGAVGAVGFVLPFVYTPLILIDGKGNLGSAMLESARLVARGGSAAHLALSIAAHAIQVAPPVLAALAAERLLQGDLVPLAMLASVPLLAASVPLGQGMITSAYAARRHDVVDRRRTRAAGRPPHALVWLWALLVMTPFLSFGMLGASLARPSRLAEAEAPAGVLVADLVMADGDRSFRPPDTALEITADAREVRVVASDGGGVGTLPLVPGAAIDRVRVLRVRDTYAIEVAQGGHRFVGWIDRAGVRRDDGLRRRLQDRAPTWVIASMLGALVATALFVLPVLASLAEVRRGYALPPKSRPAPEALTALRARTLWRASLTAVLLSPLAILSLYLGFLCVAP